MNDILIKLLEQTPVVIVLGLAVYAVWQDGRRREKEFQKEREQHKLELKEKNDYILERDKTTLETMKDFAAIQDRNGDNLEKLLNKFDNTKF